MIRIKFRSLIMLTSTVFLLAACASNYNMTFDERTKAYAEYIDTEKLESTKRINSFKFYGFSSLGDENIIITTRINKPYLITFRNRCMNLRHANFIIIHNSGSSLLAKFDSISVTEQGTADIKCFIDKIYKLTVEQKKAMLNIGKKTEEDEA